MLLRRAFEAALQDCLFEGNAARTEIARDGYIPEGRKDVDKHSPTKQNTIAYSHYRYSQQQYQIFFDSMDAEYLLDNNYGGYDWSQYTWDPATVTRYKWDPVTTTRYLSPVTTQYNLHPATSAAAKSEDKAIHITLSILSSGALGILVVICRSIGHACSRRILLGQIQKPQTSPSSADTESNSEDNHDSPPAYSASNELAGLGSSPNAESGGKDESSSPPGYSGNGNVTPTETSRASEPSPSPPPKGDLLALFWLLAGPAAYVGLHIYFAKASFVQERGPQFVGKAALIAFGIVVATDFMLISVCLTVRCIRGTCFGKRGAVFGR